jgi:hypothetical protein
MLSLLLKKRLTSITLSKILIQEEDYFLTFVNKVESSEIPRRTIFLVVTQFLPTKTSPSHLITAMGYKRANSECEFINEIYLQKVSRPSFAKLAAEHEQEITARSAATPFKTSLELQSKWISYYNNAITAEIPKTPTASRYAFKI